MENNEIIYAPIEIEDPSQMESLGITWKDVTYYKIGLKFVPVYLVPADAATREFLVSELNRKYAKESRQRRCLVPGARKEVRICPENNSCKACPYDRDPESYDPRFLSLEALVESGETDYEDPNGGFDAMIELHDVLERIRKTNPVFLKVIVMKAAGYSVNEISEALGMSPGIVQRAIRNAQTVARRYRSNDEDVIVITSGERIKQLRKAKGLTQTALGTLLGVTKGTVSTWETGCRRPEYDTLVKLCELFGCSLDYITGRT